MPRSKLFGYVSINIKDALVVAFFKDQVNHLHYAIHGSQLRFLLDQLTYSESKSLSFHSKIITHGNSVLQSHASDRGEVRW